MHLCARCKTPVAQCELEVRRLEFQKELLELTSLSDCTVSCTADLHAAQRHVNSSAERIKWQQHVDELTVQRQREKARRHTAEAELRAALQPSADGQFAAMQRRLNELEAEVAEAQQSSSQIAELRELLCAQTSRADLAVARADRLGAGHECAGAAERVQLLEGRNAELEARVQRCELEKSALEKELESQAAELQRVHQESTLLAGLHEAAVQHRQHLEEQLGEQQANSDRELRRALGELSLLKGSLDSCRLEASLATERLEQMEGALAIVHKRHEVLALGVIRRGLRHYLFRIRLKRQMARRRHSGSNPELLTIRAVFRELSVTEDAYLEQLYVLSQAFLEPLDQNRGFWLTLGPGRLEAFISQAFEVYKLAVSQMITFHQEMAALYRRQLSQLNYSQMAQSMGSIPFAARSMYGLCLSRFGCLAKHFREAKARSKEFSAFFQRCNAGGTFESHMFAILQRLVGYSALLDKVLRLSVETELKAVVRPVLEAIKEATKEMDERCKAFKQLVELDQRLLCGVDQTSVLAQDHRRLLLSSQVQQLQEVPGAESTESSVELFLFNDMILVLTRVNPEHSVQGWRYLVLDTIPLTASNNDNVQTAGMQRLAVYWGPPRSLRVFQEQRPRGTFLCATEELRQSWVETIELAVHQAWRIGSSHAASGGALEKALQGRHHCEMKLNAEEGSSGESLRSSLTASVQCEHQHQPGELCETVVQLCRYWLDRLPCRGSHCAGVSNKPIVLGGQHQPDSVCMIPCNTPAKLTYSLNQEFVELSSVVLLCSDSAPSGKPNGSCHLSVTDPLTEQTLWSATLDSWGAPVAFSILVKGQAEVALSASWSGFTAKNSRTVRVIWQEPTLTYYSWRRLLQPQHEQKLSRSAEEAQAESVL